MTKIKTTSTAHNNPSPSLFWAEKILLIIDIWQIYGILWQASQPWGAPYLWSRYSQWNNFINIDYFSTTHSGALVGSTADLNAPKWGHMNNYLLYASIYAVMPYLVLTSLGIIYRRFEVYGSDYTLYRHRIIATALSFLQISYIPTSLAVLRLYYCHNGLLDCDRGVSCRDASYIGVTFLCTLLLLPLFFGSPFLLYRLIEQNIVYKQSRDHEKRLQATEMAYSLSLDSIWLASFSYTCSSFHRKRIFFPIQLYALKALILIFFIFFRFDFFVQSGLMWIAIALLSTYWTIKWPYRVLSSNLFLFTCLFLLNIFSTYYTMDAFGVVNPFMVASIQFYGMLAFFFFAVLSLLIITAFILYYPHQHAWPSERTIAYLNSSPHKDKASKWMAVLIEAREVRVNSFLASNTTLDINQLEHTIHRLRRCWLSARSMGSIFEILLGDALDLLLRMHQERYPLADRRNEDWDAEVERGAPDFIKRTEMNTLLNQRGRRVFLKVLAARGLAEGGEKKTPKGHVSFYNIMDHLSAQEEGGDEEEGNQRDEEDELGLLERFDSGRSVSLAHTSGEDDEGELGIYRSSDYFARPSAVSDFPRGSTSFEN